MYGGFGLAIEQIPQFIRDNYEVHEWRHASVILEHEYPDEWNDIMEILSSFRVLKSEVAPGVAARPNRRSSSTKLSTIGVGKSRPSTRSS